MEPLTDTTTDTPVENITSTENEVVSTDSTVEDAPVEAENAPEQAEAATPDTFIEESFTCPACDGHALIENDTKYCPVCEGTGKTA